MRKFIKDMLSANGTVSSARFMAFITLMFGFLVIGMFILNSVWIKNNDFTKEALGIILNFIFLALGTFTAGATASKFSTTAKTGETVTQETTVSTKPEIIVEGK